MKNGNDNSITENVFNVISEKNIKPKPKIHFLLHEWFIWALAIFAFFIGVISTSLTIYIFNASRFIEHHIKLSKIEFIFQTIPFLWLLLLMFGVFYMAHAIKETKKGYKWSSSWIILMAIISSVLFGFIAHAFGFSNYLDDYLLAEMPYYKEFTNYHERHWMNPEAGVMAGVVIDVSNNNVILRRFDGKEFKIITNENTNFDIVEDLNEGMKIRVVGTTTSIDGSEVFEVFSVSPFYGRGGMRRANMIYKN